MLASTKEQLGKSRTLVQNKEHVHKAVIVAI